MCYIILYVSILYHTIVYSSRLQALLFSRDRRMRRVAAAPWGSCLIIIATIIITNTNTNIDISNNSNSHNYKYLLLSMPGPERVVSCRRS